MVGVRERRALPVGCGRQLIRWHDLVVVNRCVREREWPNESDQMRVGGSECVCWWRQKEIKWEWGRATGETWRVLERIVWWGMVYSKISNREIYINTPHFTLKFLGCYNNSGPSRTFQQPLDDYCFLGRIVGTCFNCCLDLVYSRLSPRPLRGLLQKFNTNLNIQKVKFYLL